MRSKTGLWIGVSVIAFGLSLPAFADDMTPPPDRTNMHHERMSRIDTDQDGKISPAEWKAASDARFAEADANGDGTLSEAELSAQREKKAAEMRKTRGHKMFQRADANGDGVLSKAEYDAAGQKMYERMMKHHQSKGVQPPADQD
jgi:hypothetical protein